MSTTQQKINFSKYCHLKQDERFEIAILLKKGYSVRNIAGALGRNPSSVSREIMENSTNGIYDPKKAQAKSRVKRMYSKYQGMKIKENIWLEHYIHEKIKLGWSPERISGRLRIEKRTYISHKSIYKYIHGNPFGWPLIQYLKYQGKEWKRRKSKKWGEIIKNRTFIDQRPDIINSRMRYGDFEADTMGRSKDSSAQTLVVARERKSRYVLAKKVKRLSDAMDGFEEILSPLPVKSITFDNGPENARYEELGKESYFCHPYSSCEKGSVENVIGVIREYIPKKTDLAWYSDDYIAAIIDRINNIPMKCLKFRTPRELFEGRYLQLNKERCCA